MLSIADFVAKAWKIGQVLIDNGSAVSDIIGFAKWVVEKTEQDGGPTTDDWDALHAKEETLRAKLQQS